MALRPVAEVQAELLADASLCGDECCDLNAAFGRILREDIVAATDVPPAANSAMDGYALRVADLAEGRVLPISQRIAAGHAPDALLPGTAARIFTGAVIPPGADCVVAQEDCRQSDESVEVAITPATGQHIRPRGQDIAKGTVVVARGRKLGAADLGLLASVGVPACRVAKRLKVALMSTGDELREPGEALGIAQIYNSNRPMLAALISAMGGELIDLGIVPDTAEATAEALAQAAELADVVISSGGVSVGEEDHVKAQIERLGELKVWKLAIKPGKPLAYGRIAGVPFFGLPGNPVSSFVTFCLLVRPYLLAMQGVSDPMPDVVQATVDFEWPKPGSRQEYLRVRLKGGVLSLHPQQSSGALSSVAWANALAIVPPGTTFERGEVIDCLSFAELGA
ncbi:MAG: gephyrin-like molybdotransferase Glp [Pseudomonadota bacterium]|nr:gephyrin-like molybdotransferase Glp [Pseudomonadota bacterium]